MIISDSACAPCLLLLPCLCFACLSQSRHSCEVFALVSGYDFMLRDSSPGCMASSRILLVSVLLGELINHLLGVGKRMTGLQSLRSTGLKGGSELSGSNCLLSSRAGAAQKHFLNLVIVGTPTSCRLMNVCWSGTLERNIFLKCCQSYPLLSC